MIGPTPKTEGAAFVVRKPDPATGNLALWATPLFVALVLVEIVDLIFAVDSIQAIFAITTDPYIIYTSNIFAILGLRALYFALAAVIDRFKYLKQASGSCAGVHRFEDLHCGPVGLGEVSCNGFAGDHGRPVSSRRAVLALQDAPRSGCRLTPGSR